MMHNERQATKVQLTNRGIKPKEDRHQFIINYSNIDADRIMDELLIIKDTIL